MKTHSIYVLEALHDKEAVGGTRVQQLYVYKILVHDEVCIASF